MKIAITGTTGLIGSALTTRLTTAGHKIVRLVRRNPDPSRGDVIWDPERGALDPAALEGVHAVINLAGEPVGERWTADRKRRILSSRTASTALLARTIVGLTRRPRVLINASATGIYGNRGDESLDETSSPGKGFLGDVAQAWEAATAPVREGGIRTVLMRFGMVLSANGGALEKMLPPFRLGAGGKIGDGKQWVSWIAIDDVVAALEFALSNDRLSGVVNVVAPNPVTNIEFTQALGRALHRPAVATIPAFAVKLAFGEMGEVVLSSQRVYPRALEQAGFTFRHPAIDEALQTVLAAGPSTRVSRGR